MGTSSAVGSGSATSAATSAAASACAAASSSAASASAVAPRAIERVTLAGGVLDASVLRRVDAIAQQENCVGCDGRGLADAIAKALPYGCSYADRRRMPPANKFAVPADRATPGTIDVRRPPPAVFGGGGGRPIVINLFAQWEMGAPGKYNRVSPAPPSDGKPARERWFRECLQAISALRPPLRSIAFPELIGCGLAGGSWPAYEAMLVEFAAANPQTQVVICKLAGGGGGGGGGGRGGDRCFKCGLPGHWANRCPSSTSK